MGRKSIYSDGALTSSEKSRRRADRFSQIDNQLYDAMKKIDWKRRTNAEQDIAEWVQTYGRTLLEDPPPEKGKEVLRMMVNALKSHHNYLICMSRGQGKSCYVLLSAIYAIVTGQQKFVLIVSNNARAAVTLLNDIWRVISEPDTPFSQDYPEVSLPFQLCNGSFRRRQMFNGKSTNIVRNAGNIHFARIEDGKGRPVKSSEAIIATRGYTSGLRGLRHGKQRVSCVILDDIQDHSTAENPEQVQKILDIIKKDIMPMGGKERMSILQSATPICPDDLVEKLKQDPNWITQTFPAIIKYPNDMTEHPDDGLWHEYFQLYENENIDRKGHQESLKFYREHQKEMDEGSEVFNPTRFSQKDGHITAIQKLLEIKHIVGSGAFQSEYQMQPIKGKFSLDISPKEVIANQTQDEEGQLPSGYQFAIASSDLNLSFCISTTILAFKRDGTAHVIKHIFRKSRIGGRVADAQYNKKVYEILVEHGKELRMLGIPLKGWAIDCNGQPFDAVTQFCENSKALCGIDAVGFIGKASHLFNPNVRSKLRTPIGRTVLCGDVKTQEGLKGKKWVTWDSDYYREMVQNAFLSHVGCSGCLTLYMGDIDEHRDYAIQICAEKLQYKRHKPDGRDEYYWKSTGDHDMLDSTAQAYAAAAQLGISSTNFDHGKKTMFKPKAKIRRKVKIV